MTTTTLEFKLMNNQFNKLKEEIDQFLNKNIGTDFVKYIKVGKTTNSKILPNIETYYTNKGWDVKIEENNIYFKFNETITKSEEIDSINRPNKIKNKKSLKLEDKCIGCKYRYIEHQYSKNTCEKLGILLINDILQYINTEQCFEE